MNPNSIWQSQQSKFHNELDFNIGDPSSYHCVIYRYSQSHRELAIAVHKHIDNPETNFYLMFESVWYFQGSTSWSGVDFEFADIAERKTLLQKVFLATRDNNEMLDSFVRQYALYVIYKPDITIQILAGNCFTVKTIPAL
jgi:hypothetical protein